MTKKTVSIAAFSAVLLLAPATPFALTLTNKDKADHTVGIDMGASEKVEKIAAGKSVTVEGCDDGCGVTGPWNYTRMLKTGDKVSFDGTSPVQAAE